MIAFALGGYGVYVGTLTQGSGMVTLFRVCLKNAYQAKKASFGTCGARLFRPIGPSYSPKKVHFPRTQKLHFYLRQHFSDTL